MPAPEPLSPAPSSRAFSLVPLVLIVLLLGFALFGEKGILRAFQYSRQKQALEAEVREREKTIAELRREIEALKNDLRTIEGIARRELGMVKEDELVYQFPRISVPPAETPASTFPGGRAPDVRAAHP